KLNYTAKGGREQTLQNALDKQQRPYERITISAYDSLTNKLYSDTVHKAKLKQTYKKAQNTYMDVYVAFGSFACMPCRMENSEIAKQYEELSKNMVIVNFSLDINRKEWEAAAKLDKIVWYNVSDMKGSAGKIKTIYDVQAMPTSYLIDPNGLIVERFEGYSEENITRIALIANKKTD
ncbi:MAG: redoxin domain-containing protein, partial [Pedobacter sp.]